MRSASASPQLVPRNYLRQSVHRDKPECDLEPLEEVFRDVHVASDGNELHVKDKVLVRLDGACNKLGV